LYVLLKRFVYRALTSGSTGVFQNLFGVGLMKCITYVSRVVTRQNGAMIPTGLPEIFRLARKKNAQDEITGILSYRKGHYIQVLEGPELAVDRLFSKILNDPRHRRVTALLDMPISERCFSNWDMKLLESVGRDSRFLSFLEKNSKAISLLSQNQRQLFEIFYSLDRTSQTRRFTRSYVDKDLSLTAWPDFTVVKPSPVVIELCARLTKGPHSYNALTESGEFGTRQQIDKILNEFKTLDILKVRESSKQLYSVESAATKAPNRFYSKMKGFLGL